MCVVYTLQRQRFSLSRIVGRVGMPGSSEGFDHEQFFWGHYDCSRLITHNLPHHTTGCVLNDFHLQLKGADPTHTLSMLLSQRSSEMVRFVGSWSFFIPSRPSGPSATIRGAGRTRVAKGQRVISEVSVPVDLTDSGTGRVRTQAPWDAFLLPFFFCSPSFGSVHRIPIECQLNRQKEVGCRVRDLDHRGSQRSSSRSNSQP